MEFDFKANQEVATLDTVPADFKPLYVEKADKTGFKLDTENKQVQSAIGAVIGLTAALKASRAEAKTKIDLTPLKEFGDTPESIKAKVAEIVEGLNQQVKGVDIAKIKKDLEADVTTKLADKDNTIKAQETEIKDILITDRASKAIELEKGDIELLLPIVTKHVEGRRVNGKYQVFVLDGEGSIRYSGATGNPLSIKELVAEIKQDKRYGKLFESAQRGGGGAAPGGSSSSTAVREQQRKVAGDGASPNAKIAAGIRQLSGR